MQSDERRLMDAVPGTTGMLDVHVVWHPEARCMCSRGRGGGERNEKEGVRGGKFAF